MTELLRVSIIVIWLPVLCYGTKNYSESDAVKYVEKFNREAANWTNRVVHADWNWTTNLTRNNGMKMFSVNAQFGLFLKKMNEETKKYRWTTYRDPNIKRQLKLFSLIGPALLPKDKMKEYDRNGQAMRAAYDDVTIDEFRKGYPNRTLNFNTDLAELLETSSDADELKHLWIHWSECTGKTIKHFYPEYVKLSNEAAELNNFTDTKNFWLSRYEDHDFPRRIERLWKDIRPLYLQMHAYVRRKLWKRYGDSVISRTGPIPAHLTGDIKVHSWERLVKFTLPYPDVKEINVTSALIKQKYTPKKIFEVAEEFMTSLNFSAMPQSFWEKSILEKPKDRTILCSPAILDFFDSKDFRITQCTLVNFPEFLDAHKKMAVLQYFIQYKDQPYIYRNAPIDGFQEAVGNSIGLSVSTSKHLHKIGLLPEASRSSEYDINYLYKMSLDIVAFLPFGYIIDLWRWNVFDGTTTEDRYNCDWWDLRYNLEGLEPPVNRSEKDFDPGSKYHMTENIPYIHNFVSFILQFQIHQALCEKAGQFDPNNPKSEPLYKCDIYQSSNAGNVLKETMKLGKSKHWFYVLGVLTGQRKLDSKPLLNYFKPLHEWLDRENKRTGELIGWESFKTTCIRGDGEKSGKHVQG